MSARSCSRSSNRERSRPGSPPRATASTAGRSITTTSIWPRNRQGAMVTEPGERFNACEYLLDRRVKAGDGGRLAITGAGGQLTYAELLDLGPHPATRVRARGL